MDEFITFPANTKVDPELLDKDDKIWTEDRLNPRKMVATKADNVKRFGGVLEADEPSRKRPRNSVTATTDQLKQGSASIKDSGLCTDVVTVCGVVLPKKSNSSADNSSHLLTLVPSTFDNLESLALAVSSGEPVLLEGPVGSGKTTLVEHLAQQTGSKLIKIQLGDQTDSKALLGGYRCTDIPGQFVWQTGCLAQAAIDGHWVLLEDLDNAPTDVICMLVPLLESGSLSCSGHIGQISASPNFRIFATQRLLASEFGWNRQHQGSSMNVIGKLWTKISLEPLSTNELKQIVSDIYPELSTDSVAQRLISIYYLLSSGSHVCSPESEKYLFSTEDDNVRKLLARDGRPISTRDFMKWCHRISKDLGSGQKLTPDFVFEEAFDCFCLCLPLSSSRLTVAKAISEKIGIDASRVNNICCNNKPEMKITEDLIIVGRATLKRYPTESLFHMRSRGSNFAFTQQASALLERIAVCIQNEEPVLLVGETGTGKTSAVQYIAENLRNTLHVINMNQQSDSTDLLGGYKPIDFKLMVMPLREQFDSLFHRSFSLQRNGQFLGYVQEYTQKKDWSKLFRFFRHGCTMAAKFKDDPNQSSLHNEWLAIRRKVNQLESLIKQAESVAAFSFVEGVLIGALKKGHWVLLDEINLASAETLECLSGLLESKSGSVVLSERGDTEPILRHPNFRLFACMNPAADVGKKDLPMGIRNRFTEMFVDELHDEPNLTILIESYLGSLVTPTQINGIVKFYQEIRKKASVDLADGTGRKPHYSMRTLCRALRLAARKSFGSMMRSIYEAFSLSFLTQLDRSSYPKVEILLRKHILGDEKRKVPASGSLQAPIGVKSIECQGYWITAGDVEPNEPKNYILTDSVKTNLKDLARIVSAGGLPVLLQGETSVGKTSLIEYLAKLTGNVCHRINNHEHTDVQEYIGCYTADQSGKLVFREGVLIEAMRKGYWIILDELNLAPTDVLEALNRLLDDNREIYIPETQEVVKAHSRFMLFATQNPPGLYGGRKVLSRAFRNRFVELHFSEIPSDELEIILHKRCELSPSHCKKLVAIMLDLQTRRRNSGLFAGKQGYITLRDLFRWGERYRLTKESSDFDQLLADNGFMLLAGRVRLKSEEDEIREVIEKHLKRQVDPHNLFTLSKQTSSTTRSLLEQITGQISNGFQHLVFTFGMRRMALLVAYALNFKEPVLLVGETGCGKTTVCQLLAQQQGNRLYSVNCHMHTETADFLGGLRPVRHRIEDDENSGRMFEWCDGPLVTAMRDGANFLVDEISLADDSVLERLNSVLEPERKLLLVEKGSGPQNDSEEIVADDSFRIVATMNPGGDYGKKELSPALRNRFTEIWCPLSDDREDLVQIVKHNLRGELQLGNQGNEDGSRAIGEAMVDFFNWIKNNKNFFRTFVVTVRDLLSWVNFINSTAVLGQARENGLDLALAYVHGACLVFIDSLGASYDSGSSARDVCLKFLLDQMSELAGKEVLFDLADVNFNSHVSTNLFQLGPFCISRGHLESPEVSDFAFRAPTTAQNAVRVMRALQLPRPILLEGSPGVGKTSLVAALAKVAGHQLVRINLSDQTDITDLFGADLPVDGGRGGEFAWRDGPLLDALKSGHWVVLDELNLATQSVLEGLNACLDHRSQIFIPELCMSFDVKHEKTKIFACQNPLNEGGSRKGLPKSFLNRFTQVYVDPLSRDDLLFILASIYPQIPHNVISRMVDFNQAMYQGITVERKWGQKGGPWEFNLRDLFRWADLVIASQTNGELDMSEFVHLIYIDRLRSQSDRETAKNIFEKIFGSPVIGSFDTKQVIITQNHIQIGNSFMQRRPFPEIVGRRSSKQGLRLLHHHIEPLSSLIKSVNMKWMTILIGGTCSGKTSLVELLAQLSGFPLYVMAMNSAMDTTELLGGFEQADLNRDLDLAASKVYQLINHVVKQLLNSEKSAEQILDLWSDYQLLPKADGSTGCPDDDIKAVTLRLNQLTRIVEFIKEKADSTSFNVDVVALMNSIASIQKRIDANKSLNHGGHFEWIDSVFVKCLKEGSWLLLDNVNFCSPSVLDRLNGLLEPNGVLKIDEQGTVDGKVPTVTPHPDFRLFLTMDPKNGEISRSMRNRGVEIFLSNEVDGECYDLLDLTNMIQDVGIIDRCAVDLLISVHELLKKQEGYDRFDLLCLLRAASLISQLLEKGTDLKTAIQKGLVKTYVKGCHDRKRKEKILEIISAEVTRLPDHLGSQCTRIESMFLPNINDWCQNDVLAMVRQTSFTYCRIMKSLMSVRNQRLTDVNASLEIPGAPIVNISLKSIMSGLIPAGQLLLETCSVEGLPLLVGYLTKEMQQILSSGDMQHEGKQINAMNEGVLDCLKVIKNHPAIVQIRSEVVDILPTDEFERMPFDWRWNAAVMKRLKVSDDKSQSVSQLSNQLYLIYQMILHESILKLNLKTNAKFQKQSRKASYSFLQYSDAYNSDKLNLEELPQKSIPHLLPFLSEILVGVKQQFNEVQQVTNEKLRKLLDGLGWLMRFEAVCDKKVNRELWKEHEEHKLWEEEHQLCQEEYELWEEHGLDISMHWNWLNDKFIKVLQTNNIRYSPKLNDLIAKLDQCLGADLEVSKIYSSLIFLLGNGLAFRSHGEASNYLQVEKICEKNLDLCHQLSRLDVQQRNSVIKLKQNIVDILTKFFSKDDVSAAVKTLKEFADDNQKLGLTAVKMDELTPDNSSAVEIIGISVWPMNDYMLVLQEGYLLPSILEGSLDRASLVRSVDAFLEFSCKETVVNPMSVAVLKSVATSDSSALELGNIVISNYFYHLKSSIKLNSDLMHLRVKLQPGSNESPALNSDALQVAPSSMFSCYVSSLVANILIPCDQPTNSADGHSWLLNSVTLEDSCERLHQISNLNQQLWIYNGLINSNQWDSKRNSFQLLLVVLRNVLMQFKTFLPESFGLLIESNNFDDQLFLMLCEYLTTADCNCRLTKLLPTWQFHLKDCLSHILQLRSIEDHWNNIFVLGQAWISIGLLQAHCLMPRGPVDPCHYLDTRMKYARDDLEQTEVEMQVRQFNAYVLYGCEPDLNHPSVQSLLQKRENMKEKIAKSTDKMATRPNLPQFSGILQETKNFMKNICSVEKVSTMSQCLSNAIKSRCHQTLKSCLSNVKNWSEQCSVFLNRLKSNFPYYKDLLSSFITALQQIQFGLDTMAQSVHVFYKQYMPASELPMLTNATLRDVVSTLASFPTINIGVPTVLDLIEKFTSENFSKILTHFDRDCNDGNRTKISRILHCSLLHFNNYAIGVKVWSKRTLKMLDFIINHYILTWKRTEEERKRREEEADSGIFRYKQKTLSEEEMDCLEILKQFPSHEKDFEDLRIGWELDDAKPPTEPIEVTNDEEQITTMEMELVSDIHQSLFISLTNSNWHPMSTGGLRVDPVAPLLVSYQISLELLKSTSDQLDEKLEVDLIRSHLLATSMLQKAVDQEDKPKVDTETEGKPKQKSKKNLDFRPPYDIYHDSNVNEVVRCRPLLDNLLARVNELLVEWPEHPTLKQLVIIASRIKLFPLTSSLTRFLWGLEMLLERAQDWQANAASFVSLSAQLDEIQSLVKQWRHLEIKCWKNCLDTVAFQVRKGACKWWFQIYNIIQPYLSESNTSDELDEASMINIMMSLQGLMESSTVGEFSTRLRLLLAFHCHLIHVESTNINLTLIRNICWNVHLYYKQFLPLVEKFVEGIRKPIEHTLKGCINPIAWKKRDCDKNYYSVKAEVEKSHKVLHKCMKQFKSHLAQPVLPIMVDESTPSNDDSVDQKKQANNTALFIAQKLPSDKLEVGLSDSSSDMQRFARKMPKLCREIVAKSLNSQYVNEVEEFTENVIEHVHRLQAFSVDHISDKEKQRKEAKSIGHRKRKALSDLFKELHHMGLSYQKGLSKLNSGDEKKFMLEWFVQQPCELATSLNQLPSTDGCDDVTAAAWQGCDKYFVRALRRRTILHSVYANPSKELGVNVIERSKGFAEHLSSEVCEQRHHLVNHIEDFISLRQLLFKVEQLQRLTNGHLPSQCLAHKWLMKLKDLADQASDCIQQNVLLMQSMPQEITIEGGTSPVPLSVCTGILRCQKDEAWHAAMKKLTDCQTVIVKIQNRVNKELVNGGFIIRLDEIDADFSTLRKLTDDLMNIDRFVQPPSMSCSNTTSLQYVTDNILKTVDDFNQFARSGHENDADDSSSEHVTEVEKSEESDGLLKTFEDQTKRLMKDCLIAVQDFVNNIRNQTPPKEESGNVENGKEEKHQETEEKKMEEETNQDEDPSTNFSEKVLTEKSSTLMVEDLKLLRTKQVCDQLVLLLTRISNWSTEDGYRGLLTAAIGHLCLQSHREILTQYGRIVQYFVTQHVSLLRSNTKLLTVLLAIFSDLAQKGFCLPAEYSDEAGGEGTDFHDIQDGGMGEGEGEKNVNDKIDDLGQIEGLQSDTKQPKEDEPEIEPEDNAIEMPDDFDGKLQDLKKEEGKDDNDDDDEENEEGENDIDKQMGDLGDEAEADKLDEKLWNSDDEDEDEKEDEKTGKEEFGPGDDQHSKDELGAKDDRCSENKKDKKEKEKNPENDQPFQDDDYDEFNENEMGTNNDQEDEKEPQDGGDLEIPDDLNLDGDEDGEDNNEGENPEELKFDGDEDESEMPNNMGENEEEGNEEKDGEKEKEIEEKQSEEATDAKDAETEENKTDMAADEDEKDDTEGDGENNLNEKNEVDEADDKEAMVEDRMNDQSGIDPQKNEEEANEEEEIKKNQENVGKSHHETMDVETVEGSHDTVGTREESKDEKEEDGSGVTQSEDDRGHEGKNSKTIASGSLSEQKKNKSQRRPGKADDERTMGSKDEKTKHHLKTVDESATEKPESQADQEKLASDLYEHIRDAKSHYDAQMSDAATESQQQQQEMMDVDKDDACDDDQLPLDADEEAEKEELNELKAKLNTAKNSKDEKSRNEMEMETEEGDEDTTMKVDGDVVATASVARGSRSTIHTFLENYDYDSKSLDTDYEEMRRITENDLKALKIALETGSVPVEEPEAVTLWQHYEKLTCQLSQELCEHLRLVLEPTQAAKLKGDYRTGKRISMRKVIAYIASQYRKDKIWLRRSKPSKRHYQIMVAIDDSSSMVFNQSKQLAFESLAVITNALTKLEVGELSICSFGDSVQILHPLQQTFTAHSGAKVLQRLTFEQKKTNIAQLVRTVTGIMMQHGNRHHSSSSMSGSGSLSQLLLIVSDGRIHEDMTNVVAAIRQAREAGLFLVFVILDNPNNKDSILDIHNVVKVSKTSKNPSNLPVISTFDPKLPVFENEFKMEPYMDSFPFPFYIILRDVNSLPQTLGDALRQWFELVSASDR